MQAGSRNAIAGSLGYLAPADTNQLMNKAQEIARLLNGLLVWCDSQSGTRS
jgi:hypothetical protein